MRKGRNNSMTIRAQERVRQRFLEQLSEGEEAVRIKAPPEKTMQSRALLLRTFVKMLRGATWKQKVRRYERLRREVDIYDFLGIRGASSRGRTGSGKKSLRTRLYITEQAAGIVPLQPYLSDALEELAKGRIEREKRLISSFIQKPHVSHAVKNQVSYVLSALGAADIIELKKKGAKITGFTILDRARFNETRRTGYIQWPQLAPFDIETERRLRKIIPK